MTSHYLLSLAVTDAMFSSFSSSVKASSALFLSHHLHAVQPDAENETGPLFHLPRQSLSPISERESDESEWNRRFLHVTGYSLNDIGDCVIVILMNLNEQPRSSFQVKNYLCLCCAVLFDFNERCKIVLKYVSL